MISKLNYKILQIKHSISHYNAHLVSLLHHCINYQLDNKFILFTTSAFTLHFLTSYHLLSVIKIIKERIHVCLTVWYWVSLPRIFNLFLIWIWELLMYYWWYFMLFTTTTEKQETRYLPAKSNTTQSPTVAIQSHFKTCVSYITFMENITFLYAIYTYQYPIKYIIWSLTSTVYTSTSDTCQ